jgi:uncharacterized protein YbjT (DUF2867 family)
MSKMVVLVMGATGRQGGALARALLEKGHCVRAFTRNPNSSAAQELRLLGATIVAGDIEDQRSLEQAATGADVMFAVTTPFDRGVNYEVRYGMAMADASKKVGLGHFVFASVPLTGGPTGVPHFDSKREIEMHIRRIGIPFTIIGPAFFMENLLSPEWLAQIYKGIFPTALPADRRLDYVAVADIGAFAAKVIENRESFLFQQIDLAGDSLCGSEIALLFSRLTGRDFRYVQVPLEWMRSANEDVGKAWEWFLRRGWHIDVPRLRLGYPHIAWHSFERWARQQNWNAVQAGSATDS